MEELEVVEAGVCLGRGRFSLMLSGMPNVRVVPRMEEEEQEVEEREKVKVVAAVVVVVVMMMMMMMEALKKPWERLRGWARLMLSKVGVL